MFAPLHFRRDDDLSIQSKCRQVISELKLVADNLALHWAILSNWRLWTIVLHEWKSLKLRVPHSSLHWTDHSNSSFLKCKVISTRLCIQTQNAVKVMCSSFCRWLLKLQTGLKCFIYWALTGEKSIGSVKYCNEGVILSGCTTYTVCERLFNSSLSMLAHENRRLEYEHVTLIEAPKIIEPYWE